MKKITLLFLALSSLTLAAVLAPTTGPNPTSTPNVNGTGATAGINVNVSATVTDKETDLVITDLSGTPISAVNFNHVLTAGKVADQGEQTLTTNLKIKGSALTNAGTLVSSFDKESLTLANGTNILTSTLTSASGAIASNGEASLSVTSALDSTGMAAVGTYAAQTATLTVTYTKTTEQ